MISALDVFDTQKMPFWDFSLEHVFQTMEWYDIVRIVTSECWFGISIETSMDYNVIYTFNSIEMNQSVCNCIALNARVALKWL